MADLIHVGTRKGLFAIRRGKGGKWAVERTAFLGDPVTMLLRDPRDGVLHTSLKLGHFGVKMHRSRDDGRTWDETAVPAYPAAEGAEKVKGSSLEQVWCLETGGADQPGLLWCGTLPGGLFVSRDGGDSWSLVESLWNRPERSEWFGGGYDVPGIHSVCVDPRNSRHVIVGVSCGGAWATKDGGKTWTCCATGMFAEYMPPESRDNPNIQDPHRVVRCDGAPDALWAQHHNGVFRTTDGAKTWRECPDVPPSRFGFGVAVHPREPDTAWLAPAIKDERRIPVDGKVVVSRTRDGGKSWDVLRKGLPQDHAYDLVYRHCLEVDESGDRLAMGSTTGSLWVSEDQGDSWSAISTNLPPIYCVRFA